MKTPHKSLDSKSWICYTMYVPEIRAFFISLHWFDEAQSFIMPKNFNVFRQMALGYILIVGLGLGLITPIVQAEAPHDNSYTADTIVDGLTQTQRAQKIDAFFTSRENSPLAGYGIYFVQAADKYGIDWKLLPAIATIESNGGKQACKKNGVPTYNGFGWKGCGSVFSSYQEAIDIITKNLAGLEPATARHYAGKSIDAKINAYNPPEIRSDYHYLVTYVMKKIAKTDTAMIASKATTETKQLAMK